MKTLRLIVCTFLISIASATFAGSIEQVRDAEIAFAKAFADRDSAKFFAFVVDDATFLGGARTLHGKAEVVERWSRFFKGPQAPFAWTPERVAVNADGTIGLSTGPVVDVKGQLIGTYSSVWQRQKDGSWKILFDGPGGAVACLPDVAAPVKEGDLETPDGARLHYKVVGEGPYALIVPFGFVLENEFKLLGDIATLYFYDPRDRGRSSHVADSQSLTIEQDVKDLETVRQFFKLDKFVPVGYAQAGLIAAIYANEHPERVARMIEIGPSIGTPAGNLERPTQTTPDFAKVTMPVLVLHGTADHDVAYGAQKLPNMRIVTFQSAAHASWLDDPANVFGAIRQFLRGEWPLLAAQIK